MLRMLAVPLGAFVGVAVMLFAAVGQLGKIDRQTLIAVLVVAAVAAGVVAWRARRT